MVKDEKISKGEDLSQEVYTLEIIAEKLNSKRSD